MKIAKTILIESLGAALVFGLVVGGWQTSLAADSMRSEFSSISNWLHFILEALIGFSLLALAAMIPVIFIALIIGILKKNWTEIPIIIFLTTGLVGTYWTISTIALDQWPLEGHILFTPATPRVLIRVIPIIFFGYVISYMLAGGLIRIRALMSTRAFWSVLWGWWGLCAIVPTIGLLIIKALQDWSSLISYMLALVVAIIFVVALYFIVPKIYDFLRIKKPIGSWIAAILVVAAYLLIPSGVRYANHGAESTDEDPPVILVTIDTLRADSLTCYPEGIVPRLGTPSIDSIASDGILFETAYSTAPWTRPSVPSFLSGLPPSANGAFSDERGVLVPGATTLAEIFKDHGYTTGAVVVNSILGVGSGNEQGFDYFVEEMTMQEEGRLQLYQKLIDRIRLSWPDVLTPNTNPYMERDAIKLASDYVKAHKGEKFFLWVHLLAPHQVFYPPKEYRGRVEEELGVSVPRIDVLNQLDMKSGWPAVTKDRLDGLLGMYAGEVAFSDDNMGDFIDAIKEAGIYDNCLTVISSDHGEEFYEHDVFTHGRDIYPETLQVPLIMRLPGRLNPGEKIATPVSLLDLAPTILDLSGIEPSLNNEPAVFLGRSLTPLIDGDGFEELPIFFERPLNFDQNLKGVYYRGLYYIGGADAVLHPRMYDLTLDPQAYFDISRDRPEEFQMMADLLAEYDAVCETVAEQIGATRSEADIEKLRSLGYIS